jgi:hypothetical protein
MGMPELLFTPEVLCTGTPEVHPTGTPGVLLTGTPGVLLTHEVIFTATL